MKYAQIVFDPFLRGSVNFGLGMVAHTSHKPSEGNDLLLGDHILQIGLGPVEGHPLQSIGCLPGVLKVDPKVGASGLGTLGGIIRFNGITTHF